MRLCTSFHHPIGGKRGIYNILRSQKYYCTLLNPLILNSLLKREERRKGNAKNSAFVRWRGERTSPSYGRCSACKVSFKHHMIYSCWLTVMQKQRIGFPFALSWNTQVTWQMSHTVYSQWKLQVNLLRVLTFPCVLASSRYPIVSRLDCDFSHSS